MNKMKWNNILNTVFEITLNLHDSISQICNYPNIVINQKLCILRNK